ncbi:MAG: ribonuclease Y, partial [Thiovulaceae bacterium]|nr:ribonuclease Y [Sulfurimonadaceae bacterium]
KSQKIQSEIDFAQKQQNFYTQKAEEAMRVLQTHDSLTQDEIKQQLLEQARQTYRIDIANEVRRLEEEAKSEIKKKANYILAQATTRFAGEFATERLVNTVDLPDNELKGRIIGKEGRNIKTLEQLLGVDILIDDRPNTIELSSHNLYRRAIATRTIELLVEDGRIQPARIEEIFDKVTLEFEERIVQEGEQVIADLGLASMHPEMVKMIGKLRYRASYGQNALAHTLEVAHFSGIIAAELGGDERLARRAGLLHDIGKSMTHEIGGNHVDIGAEVCTRHHEDPVVINAIYAHHDQQEVLSIECAAVCAADALSAARPGARREVLESFLKRVKEIEEIALAKQGVKQAYAINAGREVRVIINAEMINAAESAVIAQDIAQEIEARMQFPGEIKVHVIREERFIAIAT